jgi:hypothetical protein
MSTFDMQILLPLRFKNGFQLQFSKILFGVGRINTHHPQKSLDMLLASMNA